jgi:hypothetical protein
MLAQKQISKGKLKIYLSVISAMIIGTVFMLYQNYKLTYQNYDKLAVEEEVGASLPNNNLSQPDSSAGQTVKTKNTDDSGGFNLTIFKSEKFKQLKENALIAKPQSELGKRDPFKPN